MTEQQRLDAFLVAYEAIVKTYGVQLAAQIQTRQYGAMVQCEPVLIPAFVGEWQVPPSEPTGEAQFIQVSANDDE